MEPLSPSISESVLNSNSRVLTLPFIKSIRCNNPIIKQEFIDEIDHPLFKQEIIDETEYTLFKQELIDESDHNNGQSLIGLSKETFGFLCNLIGEELCNSRRSFAISPEIQILVTLRYYATGAFQAVIGDHVHVHKSTICRTIKRVSQAICRLRSQFIDFPRNAEQKNMIQTGFFQLRGFPRVISAVDCTHVKIQSPNANIGERFRNRKGYFSFNVQAICDSNLKMMNIVASFLNSDIANNENVDLWSIGKCIFCKGQIEEDSKILKCLHIICKDCTKRESTDSGIWCKCKIVTKGELIDYSIMAPNQSQVKICCEKNCQVVAKKICMHCNSMYCKPCSKSHSIKNEDHNPALMMNYPLKKEFVPCPKCMEKSVEVFCTKCLIMICAICHLNFHQTHDFNLLSTMAVETKAELQTLLTGISKENNHLNFIRQMSNENITKLKSEKKKINDKIDERIKMIHVEADKRGFELKQLLETNFANAVNSINMNNTVINDFGKENDYYYSLTSSVINCDKIVECIKLSKIIKDQMVIAKRHTQDMPKEATTCEAELIYNDEQSVNKVVESIREMGDIISTKIVSSSEFKITVDSNKVLQTLENDQSPILRSEPMMIQPSVCKIKKDNYEMMIGEDSDSSDFKPPVISCCNQWTKKLINSTSCNRSYHNDCHISSLAKDLKPKDPSLKFWKCTLCYDILNHTSNLCKKNMTDHIDSSGRKIIERLLLELYCQNEYSEYYQNLLYRDYIHNIDTMNQQQQQQQQPSSQPQMNDNQKRSKEQTDEDDCQSNKGFVVKLLGLSWSARADDILKFLNILGMLRANYNNYLTQIQVHRAEEKKTVQSPTTGETKVKDGASRVHFIMTTEGNASGQAYVEMKSEENLKAALKQDGYYMRKRCIRVFLSNRSDMERVIKKTGSTLDSELYDNCVHIRGLPFGFTKDDIVEFFQGLEMAPGGITIATNSTGRREAFVQFVNRDNVEKALGKHMNYIRNRYIEVFRSSLAEIRNQTLERRPRQTPYDRMDRFASSGGGRGRYFDMSMRTGRNMNSFGSGRSMGGPRDGGRERGSFSSFNSGNSFWDNDNSGPPNSFFSNNIGEDGWPSGPI